MKIGEFFVQLGVKADLSSVKDFAKAIGDIPLEVAGAILAIGGIQYKLAELTQQAIDTAVGLQMFTSETGLSAQELQKWQIAAEQANVSAAAVASSITSLQRNMAEIRLGRGNISPFQLLGIGVNQDAFGVLRQLRQRIKGMNPAMATNLISQMGISPEMISLLQASNSEFEKMTHLVKGMSASQEATFLRAKRALVDFGLQIRYTAFEHIETMIRALEKLWDLISKYPHILEAVGVGLAAMAAYFLPVTTAVVALILALDDLATYFTGGDSLTGRAISGLHKMAEEFKNVFTPAGFSGMTQQAWQKTLAGAMMAPLAPFAAIAGPALGGAAAMGKGGNVINIVVNATANAEHVADQVIQKIKEAFGHAEIQTNNQGH